MFRCQFVVVSFQVGFDETFQRHASRARKARDEDQDEEVAPDLAAPVAAADAADTRQNQARCQILFQ